MRRAAEGGELGLELRDLGAHDVLARLGDGDQRGIDGGADAATLRRQVDERDRRVL